MNSMRSTIVVTLVAGAVLTDDVCPTARADLLVSNQYRYAIERFDETTGAPLGDFVPPRSGGLSYPTGMVIGGDGNIYVAGETILRYDCATGAFLGVFASRGGLVRPLGLAFGPDGNLYVSNSGNGERGNILRYDGTTGAFIDVFAFGEGLAGPRQLVFGWDGNLYAISYDRALGQDQVRRYDGETGEFIDIFASGGGLNGLSRMTFGPDGDLYLSSANNDRVLRFDGSTGEFLGVFASGAGLRAAQGLAFGPEGNLYVISGQNNTVSRYDGTTGRFLGVFASHGSGSGFADLLFTGEACEDSSLIRLATKTEFLVCCWHSVDRKHISMNGFSSLGRSFQ